MSIVALGISLPTLPPLHPILVNFTAALVPVSVLSDWGGRLFKRPSLGAVGFWTLLYAVVITPVTAFAGWWWMRSMGDMDHWEMSIHMWLGISMAIALPLLVLWRGLIYRVSRPPTWGYLAAASIVVLALVVQGHLGGMMSFGTEEAPPESHTPTHQVEHKDHTSASQMATQPALLQWKDHIDLKEINHGH